MDQVTVHPDELVGRGMGRLVAVEEACSWSDGKIGGGRAEMRKIGLEVGNIVNRLGDCFDCG